MNELENYKKKFFILVEQKLGDVKTFEDSYSIKKVFNWAEENGFMIRYMDTSSGSETPKFITPGVYQANFDKLMNPKHSNYKLPKEDAKKYQKEIQDRLKKVHYDFFKVFDAEDGKGKSAFDLSVIYLSVYYEAGDDAPYSINTPTKAVLIIETDEYRNIFPSKWEVSLTLCKLHFFESDIKIIKSKFSGLKDGDKYNDKFFLHGELTTSDVLNLSNYLKTYIWAGLNDPKIDQNIT